MYVLLIVDGVGHVRTWVTGTLGECQDAALLLPANGWDYFETRRVA